MNKYILLLIAVLSACKINEKKEAGVAINLMDSPAKTSSGEPYLFTDTNGNTFLSWIEVSEGKNYLKFSKLENEKWSEPHVISSGENWFVNWADYPLIAVNGKQLMAHFLGKSGEGTFAYDVMLTTSQDEGNTWSEPKPVHDDAKQAEHGFVSILPYGENFLVAWLDGRNTVMEGMENHEGHHGQMSIRAAVVNISGVKSNEWELDNRTCDCCQTGTALTDNGPVVIYRDRSDEEIRDISIVRFLNGQWTEPKTIYTDNWKIAGCPVNGPRVDAIGNNLAIAWFSSPEGNASVRVIFSSDGGATFGEPVKLDEGKAIGRVDLVMLDNDNAMVSWMEGAEIKAVKVNRDGMKGTSINIASTSDARSSGFPQMTKSGNKLIFAWTDDKEKIIKTASVSL
ncbi:MAG TPA: sialidase family protein [Cyclobacteriaceae bacterium]|nr:sialidase family protein [Cyclobacteriaceae bacterium]